MADEKQTSLIAAEVRHVISCANRLAVLMGCRMIPDPEKLTRVGLTVEDVQHDCTMTAAGTPTSKDASPASPGTGRLCRQADNEH